LGVSVNTVQRHVKEFKGMNFEEYHDLKLKRTGIKLQQKAIEMAVHGDRTMLIFCLKNICGWSDRTETQLAEETLQKVKAFTIELYDQNKAIPEAI
jgi:hypothetical protein